MIKNTKLIAMFFAILLISSCSKSKSYYISDFGVNANSGENVSHAVAKAIETIKKETSKGHDITLHFAPGRYDFMHEGASSRNYYISNHDQTQSKIVGMAIDSIDNLTIEGDGAQFVYHGRMLPVAITHSKNFTMRNISIDFENPHISQIKIIENDTTAGYITYEVEPWVKYRLDDGRLVVYGDGWEHTPSSAIAFEGDTRHIVYRTSDLAIVVDNLSEIAPRTIKAKWDNKSLVEGTRLALRGYFRPTPGIFLHKNVNTSLQEVTVHYAEGMGLLAQLCENVTLDGFDVALKGENDPRYFTTQADATHFSGCKGVIDSRGGLYEAMMDDAINVHGTYLKIKDIISDKKVTAQYMHNQSWGFDWGFVGDSVQFVQSATMELVGTTNSVAAIRALDSESAHGAKLFEIEFTQPINGKINSMEGFGIENLTWSPSVVFADNIIRNNRARGTLFSTPKDVLVENNLFDHTSGCAILLCGDCNGWYETGACRNVVIKGNRFIGSLTNMFQFTNAIISIYPEIPNLKEQKSYFHGGEQGGIVIENNYFETFDQPILYAKSVDGLIFKGNKIVTTNEYEPFHWNSNRFLFERVINYTVTDNEFDGGFNQETDIKIAH